MAHEAVDVVLVNFCCADDTMGAIDRLEAWAAGTVWVVDNSAQDAAMEVHTDALIAHCSRRPWVRMLNSGGNIGFGRACNLAFAKSNSEYLLLLNPDARIGPDAVLAMATVMAQRPGLGALSPAVYWNAQHSFVLPVPSPQSPAQVCGMAFRTHFRSVARCVARQAVRKTQVGMAQDALIPVSLLAGAVMLVRRSAVLEAGGLFDPAYFMFFEDADLSLRLLRKGYGLAIAPDLKAVHEYRHKAFKADVMAQSQSHFFARNFPRFHRKGTTLKQLQRWHSDMPLHEWFVVLEGAVSSAEDLALRTDGQGVVAWSPSLLMEPAICRPAGDAARPLDAAEWALLEPGGYVVWLEDKDGNRGSRWTYFDKA
jgi:GT2 family glycosyltransferase